ncbi:helical backbone metal receptor [Haliangium sp.]|uniref:helical backbone metal receptor n=1 Tax=Haliangium sp. TaxID=2663208 RepID=UPI003D0BA689
MVFRIRDDRQRDLVLARTPTRVVSLVPSDTETLFALGVGARVVGRTRYCVEPVGRVEHIPVCGGTKDIDVDAVRALAPDLILCNQEENSRAPLETLARDGFAVFVSFPRRAADGVAHLARLARLLGVATEPEVRALVRRGHRVVSAAQHAADSPARSDTAGSAEEQPLSVFVPIWMDPLMTFSADTFGSDMLTLAGAKNVFWDRRRRYPLAADLSNVHPVDQPGQAEADPAAGRDTRYPRVSLDEVRARAPAAVLLPDEPYAFGAADAERLADELGLDRSRVRPVDGKDLFWYGARTIEALPRLRAEIDAIRTG